MRRKEVGSRKYLANSASLKRFPFRLNWFVLLTSSSARGSQLSFSKVNRMRASAALRKSSVLTRDAKDSLTALICRRLCRRSESSDDKKGFPKRSRKECRSCQI